MALFYKHFHCARTAPKILFFCTAFFWLACVCGSVHASQLFTVEDVKVDVTADNAVAAREQAFNEAQVKAFEILSERMLSGRDKENFVMPDVSLVSRMIKDFEVTKEKLSNVRYIGTYKFRFKQKDVQSYFSQSGVSYTDVASKQNLILPFYKHEGRMVLWSPFNLWMQAWNRYEGKNALVPVVIPMGDLSDVQDISDDEALSYNKKDLKNLSDRYGAGETIITIATPNEALSMIDKATQAAEGSLIVSIYRTDRDSPQLVEELMVSASEGDTRESLYDKAVVQVQKVLQQDWKNKTVVNTVQESVLSARIPLQSFKQWTDTQRVLKQVVGINDVKLQALSPREASVDIFFRGNEERLRLALRQADITLGQPRPRQVNSNRGYYNQQASDVVYDLYLNRYAPSEPNGYEQRF